MKQTKENQVITIIDHAIRLTLDLSCNEYCIAAYIATKANTHREQIGKLFGLSKQSVIRILQHLETVGLIERQGGKLRTTEKWNTYFIEVENYTLSEKSKETLPKNYIFKLWRPAKKLVPKRDALEQVESNLY